MSISSRIWEMNNHLLADYEVLTLAGADLTNVDKNIVNLKMSWKERLLYFMNNGTDIVWNNWNKVTGSGTTLSINGTVQAPMSLVYKGQTSQTGTPTPTTPISVQVVSGDNTITVTNSDNTQSANYPISLGVENLLNILSNLGRTTSNGITYVPVFNDDGTLKYISVNGTASASAYIQLASTQTLNGSYTLSSGIGINNNIYIQCLRTSDYTAALRTDLPYNTGTFENVNIVTYLYVKSGYTANNVKIYPMIEKGSKANSYTPYGRTPIELCKIGTYQDKIFKNTPNTTDYDSNLEDNLWYLKKEIGKVVLNGSENWILYGTNTTGVYQMRYNGITSLVLKPNLPSVKINTLCNRYISKTSDQTYLKNQGVSISTFGNVDFYDEAYYTNVNDYKAWLNTHNIELYYPLAIPTYEYITDTTLISQLEALKKSYESVTNISQTNNDLPFELSVVALSNE